MICWEDPQLSSTMRNSTCFSQKSVSEETVVSVRIRDFSRATGKEQSKGITMRADVRKVLRRQKKKKKKWMEMEGRSVVPATVVATFRLILL